MFSPISSIPLDVVFSTYNTVIFAWRPTLTVAMQAIVLIKNLFLGIAHSLARTLSHGRVKNNTLSPVLKLNIVLWCMLPLRCYGYFFLHELGLPVQGVMPIYCDNQAAFFLSSNPTFHEHTKHIEIDCHAIRHQVRDGLITTPYVGSSHQLVDILTKWLSTASYDSISRKLGLFDLYAPSWGRVWVYMAHNGTFVILDLLLSVLSPICISSPLFFSLN